MKVYGESGHLKRQLYITNDAMLIVLRCIYKQRIFEDDEDDLMEVFI